MTEQKEHTLTCSVVKDLMPLYYDAEVSLETAHKIEVHMNSCENCRLIYENFYKDEEILKSQKGFYLVGDDLAKKGFQRIMKKSIRKSVFLGVLVGIFCFFLIFIPWYAKTHGFPIVKFEDVEIQYEKTDLPTEYGEYVVSFTIYCTEKSGNNLVLVPINGSNSILKVKKVWDDSAYKVGPCYPMYDLKTGEPIRYNSYNELWLHFSDRSICIELDKVAEELGLQ